MKRINVLDIHQQADDLEIYMFNVGQGDHILIKFPNMEYGIIDFHYECLKNLSCPPSLSYFQELKDVLDPSEFEKLVISFICISHTDKDHIKGIVQTFKWFRDNNILIKNIWQCGARDFDQLSQFVREGLEKARKKLKKSENDELSASINVAKGKLEEYFKNLEKWKEKKLYKNKDKNKLIGYLEYLSDIRHLPSPCSLEEFSATNIGPLGQHIDDYYKELSLQFLLKFIGYSKIKIDKNILSHILKITFGESTLLFGGDTHINIWKDCLSKYDNEGYNNIHGDYKSRFIKVSHHGAKNSSNNTLWDKISCSRSGKLFYGISAGKNESYIHPDSETISEIRTFCTNNNLQSGILCTNICEHCVNNRNEFNKEYHVWYDNHNTNYYNGGYSIGSPFLSKNNLQNEPTNFGLFAYIFVIPKSRNSEIKVRMALTTINKSGFCFYNTHSEKLYDCCE